MPDRAVDAWLVCDASSELRIAVRALAVSLGRQPVVASVAGVDLALEPLAVEHTSHPTFGYMIRQGSRRVVWAPEFLRFPGWAAGCDLMFAEAAGWDRPIRFARGAGGHAATLDVAQAAMAAGVRRLVFAHIGRPTIRALDAGHRLPFGEIGIEGRTYVVRRHPGERTPAAGGDSGHETLPHTADAGIRAWAPDLGQLFEEAGLGLAEIAADVDPGIPLEAPVPIELEAADLPALAYRWLNELVWQADARGAAVGAIDGVRVELADPGSLSAGWRLTADVRHVMVDGRLARRRLDVKAATYHRLSVSFQDGRWTMEAYVDV
jgi:SHS2 domain-containing protein